MRFPRKLAVFLGGAAAAVTITASTPGVALAADSTASAATTLAQAGGLVAHAVPTTSDAQWAAQSGKVQVPVDPAKGVSIKTSTGQTVTVGLPNAAQLGQGVRLDNGVVLYRGSSGFDEYVVPAAEGAQFLTRINSADAPENYAYPSALPQGVTSQVVPGGGIVLLDSNHTAIGGIAPAWAVDASKNAVPTSYLKDGSSLTQHIAHRAAGVSYPVLADPNIEFRAINFRVKFSKQEVQDGADKYWGSILPALAGLGCGALKNWILIGSCVALVTGASYWISQTFEDAKAANQCAWVDVSYDGDLDGWDRGDC